MEYRSISLFKELNIDRVYTVRYFEYMSDFVFDGERHDFWEIQYVDKGHMEVETDNGSHILTRGQAIFHKPNEFHSIKAADKTAPNLIVVSFHTDSECMKALENQIIALTDEERTFLGLLISEAENCIQTPLNDPYVKQMKLRENPIFGSQQLIINYLELFLIHILRRCAQTPSVLSISRNPIPQKYSATYSSIVHYLENHIRENISTRQICRDNLVGNSQLQKIFHDIHQCGIIEFFSYMKIEFAKQLIRENQMNFTQISDFLGFSSVHYFSRRFKKITGMTPSEYASSVKSKSERPKDEK